MNQRTADTKRDIAHAFQRAGMSRADARRVVYGPTWRESTQRGYGINRALSHHEAALLEDRKRTAQAKLAAMSVSTETTEDEIKREFVGAQGAQTDMLTDAHRADIDEALYAND